MRAYLCINIFFTYYYHISRDWGHPRHAPLERNARRTRCKLLGYGHLGITNAINKNFRNEIREWKHHYHEKWDPWMNTLLSHSTLISVFLIIGSLNFTNKIKLRKILCWIENVSSKVGHST